MNKIIKCPTCKKELVWSKKASWRPFCSERCKLIDLGEWASEGHRIAGEPALIDNADANCQNLLAQSAENTNE